MLTGSLIAGFPKITHIVGCDSQIFADEALVTIDDIPFVTITGSLFFSRYFLAANKALPSVAGHVGPRIRGA